ncbi:CinA family protein [Neptunomonas sp.]|uniref:CinA family protein n=1 Tax=Neptunomonas sp. TaxID=1971898 RepID=UPI00356A6AA5
MLDIAEKVGRELELRGMRMATAESCTGGWIAQEVTAVAGSSAWLECGFVTYSNRAKHTMLGVEAAVIETYGAVSEQVVIQMAEGALQKSGADIAVAVSGVAGPGGGSAAKPVGTVWLAWAMQGKPTVTLVNKFDGNRESVRQQSVQKALEGVLDCLQSAFHKTSP